MTKTRVARLVAFPAALILTLAACGGSSTPAAPAETVAAGDVVVETTAAAADTVAADTVAAATSETTPAETTPAETTPAAAAGDLKLKTAGKLTVCSDIPYAPFEYYENGTDGAIIGVDADLLNAIAADNGLTAEFIKTPFDGIFASLEAGNCDLIGSSVSITPERSAKYDFSNGYFKIQQTILTTTGNEALNDLPALKGKVVGAQAATTGADFAKAGAEANGYSVKEFQGADEMVAALRAKQIDAVIQDSPINGYAATQSPADLVLTKVFAGEGEAYGFVLPKTSTGLRDAINASLKELEDTGTYKTIVAKYLGAAAG